MTSSVDVVSRLAAIVDLQIEILSVVSDPERVLNLIVSKIVELTNGTGAAIEMIHGEDLVFHAVSGTAAGRAGFHIPLEASLAGLAIRERKVMRCDDIESDHRVDTDAARQQGVRSLITAPLLDGDTAMGALVSLSGETEAFRDLDSYMLQLLAGITSSALVRARDLREHHASETRYRMLFDKNVAGVFRSTVGGRILDCNDALVEYLGYDSREDLLTREAWELYRDRADRETLLNEMRTEKAVRNARIRFRKKDGSPMIGVINICLIPAEDGETQLLGTLVEEAR